MTELRELIALIEKHGYAEFEVQREGFRLHIRRNLETVVTPNQNSGSPQAAQPAVPAPQPAASSTSVTVPQHPGAGAETAAADDLGLQIVKSPIVGTFYRAASPNADPFVKIGSRVEPDSIVCIIEAMKLMNEIQAEASGVIEKIYVENGQPVEYGQPLFGISE